MGPDNAEARTLVAGLFAMAVKGASAAGLSGSTSCEKQTKGMVLMAWHGDHLAKIKQSSETVHRKITPPFEDTPRGTKKGPAPKQNKQTLLATIGRVVMTPAHEHQTILSVPVVTQVFIGLTKLLLQWLTCACSLSLPEVTAVSRLKSTFIFGLRQLLILPTRSSHSRPF